MPGIRYISNYYRMTKVEIRWRQGPTTAPSRRTDAAGTIVPGPRLLPPQYPEPRGAALAFSPALMLLESWRSQHRKLWRAQDSYWRKQWELAALAPFQLLHGTALPAFDKTKQPPSAVKWRLRQRMEKKEGRSFGPGPRRQHWCLRH